MEDPGLYRAFLLIERPSLAYSVHMATTCETYMFGQVRYMQRARQVHKMTEDASFGFNTNSHWGSKF